MRTDSKPKARLETMLADARQQIRLANPVSIADCLCDYLVLDVREPGEVLEGYLPGAVNIPRGTLEFRLCGDARFDDRQRPILTYSGDGRRSALAALTLVKLGYCNVLSLDGGFHRWAMENLPVE